MLKKFLIAAATVLATLSVSAQQPVAYTDKVSVFAKTDYTRATGSSWYSNYENHFGVATTLGNNGSFDAAVIYSITKTNESNDAKGAEVGWSLGTKYEMFDLTGRIGLGGISYEYYYSLQGEAKYNLNKEVMPLVQYRFRDGFESAWLAENRLLFGADFLLAKNLTARLGYSYTAVKGPDLNGLTGAISYEF